MGKWMNFSGVSFQVPINNLTAPYMVHDLANKTTALLLTVVSIVQVKLRLT